MGKRSLLSAMLQDLVAAAEQFRKYEVLHRAKNTEDSLAKAEVNRQLAERLEATIKFVKENRNV